MDNNFDFFKPFDLFPEEKNGTLTITYNDFIKVVNDLIESCDSKIPFSAYGLTFITLMNICKDNMDLSLKFAPYTAKFFFSCIDNFLFEVENENK